MSLADRLRHARDALGLTQEELARRSGVTLSTVARSERGLTIPGGDTLTKLAMALRTTPNDLLGFGANGATGGNGEAA